MSDREDAFSDVKQYRAGVGGGIFEGSEGLGELNQARTNFSRTRTGLTIEVPCQQCGQPNGIEVDWEELIRIMMKMVPPNWFLDAQHGLVRPHVGCRGCAVLIGVGLTPQECQRAVNGGVEAGHLSKEQVARAIQYLQSLPSGQV